MPKLSVDLDVLRHAVLDHSLSEVGDSLMRTAVTAPATLGSLSLAPAAEMSIQVFNRPEDKDQDAVFGERAHIPWHLQRAWVKYKLSARADAKLPLPAAGMKASRDVQMSDYRVHVSRERAWNAIKDDLEAPRSILRVADVERLAKGEALAVDLGGSMSTSVSLSLADVIASRFRELTRGLAEGRPIALKLKSGLDTSVSVRVTDRFTLVISRADDGRFRMAVKKSTSRDHTLGFEVSFGAEATAVPAIEEALAPLFEAVTGIALDAAERAVQSAGTTPRSSEEAEVIDLLARRLGVHTREKREAAVRAAMAKLKAEIRKRLEAIVARKASTGFAYEYARIEESEAIADFVLLDERMLARDHAMLLSGQLAEGLRRDGSSRAIVRYLNEAKMTHRSSSGFSLGIGKWALRVKDGSAFSQTIRTSLDGFRHITCRGTRRYDESRLPQNDFEWVVDLKAEMREFLESPTTRDFDYGLHSMVELERNVLRKVDLERMLDFAAMWDISPPPAADLAGAIGRKTVLKVQLLFDAEDLLRLSAVRSGLESWADPLAAAMPFSSRYRERRTVAARRETYGEVWRAWLLDPSIRPLSILRKRITSGLILFEEKRLPGSFAWNSGDGHPRLRSSLTAFSRGTRELHEAMSNPRPPGSISRIYGNLEKLWSQRLSIAASGRWLLDRAADAGVDVNRSLQIEYDDTTVVA